MNTVTTCYAGKPRIVTILRSWSDSAGATSDAFEINRVQYLVQLSFHENMGVSCSETSCRKAGELLPNLTCNGS